MPSLAWILSATLVAAVSCNKSGSDKEPSTKKSQPAAHIDATAASMELPPHQVFASASAALAEVLKLRPRVLGIGEFHERTTAVNVQSTLQRFGTLIDQFRGTTSDFILETWVKEGKCGRTGKKVERDVAVTTQRPAHTESEMLRLLKRAKKIGIQPHVLKLKCGDYEALLDPKGQVDYGKVLSLMTHKLRDLTTQAVKARNAQVLAKKRKQSIIIVYGGALHNNLYPYDSVKEYSYALPIKDLPAADYVELDLYVPEYVEGDELLRTESWYPLLSSTAANDKVVLITRGPRSYILLMKKGLRRTGTGPHRGPRRGGTATGP